MSCGIQAVACKLWGSGLTTQAGSCRLWPSSRGQQALVLRPDHSNRELQALAVKPWASSSGLDDLEALISWWYLHCQNCRSGFPHQQVADRHGAVRLAA